ncbi:bifunctional folylpolyglutamate synthase/dihydrofolate synthase [Propylenella binzhouense]|uniref:tetrahydrofolate synthase n=1 Tax=Propylenella binzhouense TaxID=2555902 RepID=A0A964T979_9HYPH|nr:folylpolyglutamate synthase/dihydrofolate synthase family protein [Propylenella binzhouense]MYZ50207.1 bifunctional folylpolyglutamate synthase/dihydrofolate synthase [Propylenella binzhouense]
MSELARMLDALGALHPRRIDLSLDRIERLLDALGRPQDRLPPVVHVAGTNGKGSTVAFLRAFAEAAGLAAHVYTSPHLVRFNERIRLGRPGGGRLVADDMLVEALARVRDANGGRQITFFEVTTAAALLLFAEQPADLCLLEVGLGGRFDATNVVDAPLAAVLTSISHDHADFLGDDLLGIAQTKAGILKRGRPGIIGPQDEHVTAMLEVEAGATGADLFLNGQDWSAHQERGRLVYQDVDGLLDLPLPRLAGAHQIDNAGIAIATVRRTGLPIPTAAIEAGLLAADWPARLQRLRSGPLLEIAPDGADIWLDGGHNPAAGHVLASAMAEMQDRYERPLVLIVGMLTTKDPRGFFSPFAGLVRHVLTVPVPDSEAGFTPDQLADFAMEEELPARAAPDVRSAIAQIARDYDRKPPPRILICGSLYLAGSVLRENGPLPE